MSGRYIVLFTYGAGIAGLYAAANKLPAVISMVSQVFQQAWQLNSAREYQSRDHEVFFENVWKIYSSCIFLFGAIAIGATPILARITLKNDFFEARYYIPLMMLAVIISCLSTYFGSLIIAYKKTKVAMTGMLLGAFFNLLLAILLVKPMGIWGVLIASIICYLTILIHRIINVRKEIMLDIHLEIIIPQFVILIAETILMCFDSTLCHHVAYGVCALMLAFCIVTFRKIFKLLPKQ